MKEKIHYSINPIPLVDLKASCVKEVFMKIGIRIGNTIHVMTIPKMKELIIIYEKDLNLGDKN